MMLKWWLILFEEDIDKGKVVKIGDIDYDENIVYNNMVVVILVKIGKWMDYFSWDEYFMVVVFFLV